MDGSQADPRYVVLISESVGPDLEVAAELLAEGFSLSKERAAKLLSKAPGPVTRPIAEREARMVAGVLRSANVAVEVRQGGAQGPVMEWLYPEAPARKAPTVSDSSLPVADEDGAPEGAPEPEPATDPAAEAVTDVAESEIDPKKTFVPGMTVTALPRDPMKTTLTREPPKVSRGGLTRLAVQAALLPALLTLVVVLLTVGITLFPALTNAEERGLEGAAQALAVSIERLSGGAPLDAPLIRVQLAKLGESTAERLPDKGVDLLVVRGETGENLFAWYRGVEGLGGAPTPLLEAASSPSQAEPSSGLQGAIDLLQTTLDQVLTLAGVREPAPLVATVALSGGAGSVIAASESRTLLHDARRSLLTTALLGLIPLLIGILVALSLTRRLRRGVAYLLQAADRISHGDMEQPVKLDHAGELGQIAESLERMRLSLSEAMERLRRR